MKDQCQHCDALRERIAWLESELGLQEDMTQIAKIEAVTPKSTNGRKGAARFIMALFRANGRVLTHMQLLEAVPPTWSHDDERHEHITRVWACGARKMLGDGAVQSVWGRGYRLTEAGLAAVAAILQPEARAA